MPIDETDWLRSADACRLLDYLFPMRGPDTGPDYTRKLRLYLVGLCRAAWRDLPPAGRALTELAEFLADRPPEAAAVLLRAEQIGERLLAAFDDPLGIAQCEEELRDLGYPPPSLPRRAYAEADWQRLISITFLAVWSGFPQYKNWVVPADHRADLVRDLFGNPFRGRPQFDPGWLTPSVVGMARGVYESRNFTALPILADALEEAGCHDRAVLSHCRDEPTHARGCWVVDLIRGVA